MLKQPETVATILDPTTNIRTLVNLGITKVNLPFYKMLTLGFLAGVYIGFGGQILAVILADFDTSNGIQPATGSERYLAGMAFSVGLICILVCGAELFTGNVLITVAALAGRVTILQMLWDWLVVYFANFLGVIFISAIIYGGGVNGYYNSVDIIDTSKQDRVLSSAGTALCKVASGKASLTAAEMFFRGIPANMLVCLAVICAKASRDAIGKIFGIAIPIGTFIASGFEHSIANMYTFTMATMLNCKEGDDHGRYWLNLLLCTIGNIIGASILGLCYWLSYVYESDEAAAAAAAAEKKAKEAAGSTSAVSSGSDQNTPPDEDGKENNNNEPLQGNTDNNKAPVTVSVSN